MCGRCIDGGTAAELICGGSRKSRCLGVKNIRIHLPLPSQILLNSSLDTPFTRLHGTDSFSEPKDGTSTSKNVAGDKKRGSGSSSDSDDSDEEGAGPGKIDVWGNAEKEAEKSSVLSGVGVGSGGAIGGEEGEIIATPKMSEKEQVKFFFSVKFRRHGKGGTDWSQQLYVRRLFFHVAGWTVVVGVAR